jgi:hypothetical protein
MTARQQGIAGLVHPGTVGPARRQQGQLGAVTALQALLKA